MMTNPLTLNRRHSALLLMDFQNEVVSGIEAKDAALLNRAVAVLGAGRAAGVAVVYVVVRFREGYPEVSPRNRGFSALKAAGRLREGTPGAEIHPRLAPLEGEVVVVKRRTGAFSATDLETVLRARDITTLVLMGIATSGVVLSTVRWAADADYELVVVEDCCADGDEEVHRVLTQKVFPRQASVVSSAAVVEAFGGAHG